MRSPRWDADNPLASHDMHRRQHEAFVHFRCRRCAREFRCTVTGIAAWAVDAEGRALEDRVSQRWLAEVCPGEPPKRDDYDRKRTK